jgi:prophage regulatory protein
MSAIQFDKNDRLLGLREVLNIVKVSKATIYREISADRFPSPIKLFGSRVCWRESEVFDFVNRRIAARNQQEQKSKEKENDQIISI